MANIDEILAKLDKKTRDTVRRASELERDFIPTPSFGLNMYLGGGFPKGHQTTLYGAQSAGKSTMMLGAIGQAHKAGIDLSCVYFDAEKTMDKEWATKLGVDTEQLVISHMSRISDITDVAYDFIKAGTDLVVIDSISHLKPGSFYEKDGTYKDFERTGQIGQQAKELGQMCRMLNGEGFETALVLISQMRLDITPTYVGTKPSGGKEVGHSDSVRIRLNSTNGNANQILDEIQYGEVLIQEKVGRKGTWLVEKNKITGKEQITGDYKLYSTAPNYGYDKASEIIDYGLKFGLITGSTWLTIGDKKFQGAANAAKFLRENPDVQNDLEKEIIDVYQSL